MNRFRRATHALLSFKRFPEDGAARGPTLKPIDINYWALLTLPLLFWSAYHYYHDRHRPEPLPQLAYAIVLGYLSAYLGIWLYEQLDIAGLAKNAWELESTELLVYAVTVIGPVEEIAKFLPFMLLLVHNSHFDEALDGVIYASFIAMGFALHENQDYLLILDGGTAVGRAIASPMVHILFASIWGYAYGYADTHGINRAVATIGGLLLAMVLHGVYDFFVIRTTLWTHIVPPLLILVIWLTRTWLIARHARTGD